jgi:hypothetical protein
MRPLLRASIPNLIFAVLVIFNSVRIYRHAMWSDEVQAFTLAAASSTPFDLFAKLKYEGHPGLWHLVLWLISFVTTDPRSMQVVHLIIALGIWLLIWRLSPFTFVEKILLLLSYYLFWEYFVISRNYAIGVLLGLGFVTLVLRRPEQRFWPWILLGLLANTSIFGAIWSFGLAALFVYRNRNDWRALIPGAATFIGLTALAIATMLPAPDFDMGKPPTSDISRLNSVRFVVHAFFPLVSPFVRDSLIVIHGNLADGLSKLVQASVPVSLIVLALPALGCWAMVRDRSIVASYMLIIVGMMLFSELWMFEGSPRHHGFLFVALIGMVWMWRVSSRQSASWIWIGLLLINAIGGLTTLSSELRPYSQSRNVAMWLERHGLRDSFLIGSRDSYVSPIAGYLGRPLYYLECECFGTYEKWNDKRVAQLGLEEFLARVARVLDVQNRDTAIVILSQPFDVVGQRFKSNLVFETLERFPEAIKKEETYVVYRVTEQRSENHRRFSLNEGGR